MEQVCVKSVLHNTNLYSHKTIFMREKHLQHDMFLYEFSIRILGVLATILFTLLFFYGAMASAKPKFSADKQKTATVKAITVDKDSDYTPLGDMH